MKLDWDRIASSKPSYYGRTIIEACGLKHPPIDERTIADFMGNKIEEVSPRDAEVIARWPLIPLIFKKSSAHLFRQLKLIVINQDQPKVKKRTDAFHDSGHDALPWQDNLNFACSDAPIDPETHKQIEQEAFECGSEMMFPLKMFYADATSIPIEKNPIKPLARQYDASLEVTAKRYAQVYPGICAVVIAEPVVDWAVERKETEDSMLFPMAEFESKGKSKTHRSISYKANSGRIIQKEVNYPMRVKYANFSSQFPGFIHSGTLIPETSKICQTFSSDKSWQGELPASDFGFSYLRPPYLASCFTFGFNGDKKVMALLWLPDKQLRFFK